MKREDLEQALELLDDDLIERAGNRTGSRERERLPVSGDRGLSGVGSDWSMGARGVKIQHPMI